MFDYVTFETTVATLLILLAIFTILINGTCIYTIVKKKTLRKQPTSYFKLNLLFICLFQGILVFPLYTGKKLVSKDHTSQYHIYCDGFRFTYMTTFYGGVFAVLLISIDRLTATSFVLQYQTLVTNKRAVSVIASSWIYIIVLCILPFKINSKKSFKVNNQTSTSTNQTDVEIILSNCHYQPNALWTLFMLGINCCLPLLLIIIFYKIITNSLNKHLRKSIVSKISSNSLPGIYTHEKDEIKRNKSITKLSLMLCVTYIIFWLPSIAYYVLIVICPIKCFPDGYNESVYETYVSFIIKYLAYLNAIVAPLIYCFYHQDFRKLLPCNLVASVLDSNVVNFTLST